MNTSLSRWTLCLPSGTNARKKGYAGSAFRHTGQTPRYSSRYPMISKPAVSSSSPGCNFGVLSGKSATQPHRTHRTWLCGCVSASKRAWPPSASRHASPLSQSCSRFRYTVPRLIVGSRFRTRSYSSRAVGCEQTARNSSRTTARCRVFRRMGFRLMLLNSYQ